MMQMTGSRRRSLIAVMAVATLSMALAGCGRRGPLEAPPALEAAPAATTVPATTAVP